MLTTYRLDNPATDETMVLDGWSYIGGAIGGPFYVLSKRLYGLAALMLLVTLALASGALLGLLISVFLFDASIYGLALMLAIVVGAIVINGIIAVRLVHYGYLRRGWRIGY